MTAVLNNVHSIPSTLPLTMRALCFIEKGKIEILTKPVPTCGPLDALIKVIVCSICGTDIHILRGDYPVKTNLTLGHEPVGVIAALGSAVEGYAVGERVVVGAITPCGSCDFCARGHGSQCGGKSAGGWLFGSTMDGAQAQYLLVPHAQYNLAKISSHLRDTEALLCPDVMTTGFSGPEKAKVKIGDSVAIFAQGPIGLSSTIASRLMGATNVIGVSSNPHRLSLASECGCDHVVNYKTSKDVVQEILDLTGGTGVDVAVEACGIQMTFDNCIKVMKPGGTMANLGVYGKDLCLDIGAYGHGIADKNIVSSLCPGGKERMARMMSVLESKRAPVMKRLVSHYYTFDQILEAYDTFENQKDNCMKVAIFPNGIDTDHFEIVDGRVRPKF